MDPATIGAQIKAKYPQYAQYPDAVIGARWIAVHQKPAGAGTGVADPTKYLGSTATDVLGTADATKTSTAPPTPDLGALVEQSSVFEDDPILGGWYSANKEKLAKSDEELKRRDKDMKVRNAITTLPQVDLKSFNFDPSTPNLNGLGIANQKSNLINLNLRY